MNNKLYLMHRDNPVIDINNLIILNMQLLPYALFNRGRGLDKITIYKWVQKRAIPLNRKNSDKIYQAAGLSRDCSAFDLMIQTHGLSINDNYWIAREDELNALRWDKINLYKNKLSESLMYLAFTGSGPATISSDELSPEYTGQGTYAKCFKRNEQNGLEIYKRGTTYEIFAEVITSYICKILNIPAIEYRHGKLNGIDASISKIYTNEDISWVSAFDFAHFTEEAYRENIYNFAEKYYKHMYYAMILIDGLTLNEDRHLQNWSIQVSGVNNNIVGMAPLYDFNKSFTGDNKSISQFIEHKNILSAARDAEDVLQIDLVSSLYGLVNKLPKVWQEPFYSRLLYITRRVNNQRGCY